MNKAKCNNELTLRKELENWKDHLKGGGGTFFLQSIEYYSESHKVVVLILIRAVLKRKILFFLELISSKVSLILNRGKNIKSARKCNFITCISKNNDKHCNDKK